ncbi:MAG: HPr family phosphocarrier protein, partial [Oscillospiraceae bacterium]|nr:HPr family phosphocarrier protein [Oscillospiraceae bacterium]
LFPFSIPPRKGLFSSEVKVGFRGGMLNGKSIMSLIAACIKCGEEIEIQCSGPDERAALKKALELVKSGLGET